MQFKPYYIESNDNARLKQYPLAELLSLVTQYKLVLIRGLQALSRDELLNYCQNGASLLAWDFGPVMEMKVDKHTKNYLFTNSDVPLHWDGAFHQEPRFLVFQCVQAPDKHCGGDSIFVDTELVWNNASIHQRKQWQTYALSYQTEKLAHYGGNITRQLVSQHPDKKSPILRFAEPVNDDYLNPVKVRVMEKSEVESSAILSSLAETMRHPISLYQHVWEKGDILIADNFSLLHGRHSFQAWSPRHLRRIQIL